VDATLGVTKPGSSRHAAVVRVTHWLTVVAFLALLVSGLEIVISHPRFYWGAEGNVNVHPLFTLPIPASRDTVPTRFGFVMPDQNGWSRSLHFEAAWLLLLTGLVYVVWSLWTGHFRRDLIPARAERSWAAFQKVLRRGLRHDPADGAEASRYNVVQRVVYLVLIFGLFPLVVWTGLAMSPAFVAVCPWSEILLGGRQTARTLHFLVTWALVLFVVVHVVMVSAAGFRSRMRGMTTGRAEGTEIETQPVAARETA
jgi:thiosulfate reductase cytochrome b subunit